MFSFGSGTQEDVGYSVMEDVGQEPMDGYGGSGDFEESVTWNVDETSDDSGYGD